MLIPKKVFAAGKAASTDVTRYQICGIHFWRDGAAGQCWAAATNGRILAEIGFQSDGVEQEYPHSADCPMSQQIPDFKVTIPTAAAVQIEKAIPRVKYTKPILESAILEETPSPGIPGNGEAIRRKFFMATTDLSTWTKLDVTAVEGIFPDYRQVLPEKTEPVVVFNPEILIQALQICAATMNRPKKGEADDYRVTLSRPENPNGPWLLEPMGYCADKALQVKVAIMPCVEWKGQPSARDKALKEAERKARAAATAAYHESMERSKAELTELEIQGERE